MFDLINRFELAHSEVGVRLLCVAQERDTNTKNSQTCLLIKNGGI